MHVEIITAPDGSHLVGSYKVTAPVFTNPDQYGRALHRAITDGIMVQPTARPGVWITSNPRTGSSYTTTRRSCSCRAGQLNTPCKHLAVLHLALALWNVAPGVDAPSAALYAHATP